MYVYICLSPTSLAFSSPADVHTLLSSNYSLFIFLPHTHTPTHAEPTWSEWTTRMDEKVTKLLETLGKGSRFEGLDEVVQAQKELEEKVRSQREEEGGREEGGNGNCDTFSLFIHFTYLTSSPLLALPKHRRRKNGCSKA